MKKEIYQLEAIRGFAALYVVFHHTLLDMDFFKSSGLSFLFRFGQEAVILFFLLSGFVIEYSFSLSKDKTFTTYFFKRFNRIYIPLFIVFITNYLLFKFSGIVVSIDLNTFLGNLFMLQDIGSLKPNVVCGPLLGNSPLWSLSYEWWFYMTFFVIYVTFGKRTSKAIYLIGIASGITYFFFPFVGNRILLYLIIWNVGADLARLYINNRAITFKNMALPISALTVGIGLLLINYMINKDVVHQAINFSGTGIGVSPLLELRHFAFALVAVIVGILWYKLKWLGFRYTLAPFIPLAKISYVLYISHWFMIRDASYLSFIDSVFVEYVLYFAICLAFSWVVERVIYPKVNKLVFSLLRRKRTAEVVG
ncbi:acyltransferase family protein [Parapedobacter koreensis]|uniref:Peptidoglycan/LPS O-acetylase OafA/YrhL, contains acyltransferase and SGNH-hydrolase domains n=1 Tax=Parapedobacter koreensis TaxID=332977 RepID=A0A1H7NLT1_9SPHI|nr:acyltransferase [Parapedobacter koreensis]SEL24483.1 Peptidoglycan/LPS O-acetylase OafA/YrhL, contains acyltransferase and SGNH-hydrolase domains [Parapedobacter koreensis]